MNNRIINGAICIECERWYSLAELKEIEETEIVPCGHSWTGLFDTIEEDNAKEVIKEE